jgi:hypothetical protein
LLCGNPLLVKYNTQSFSRKFFIYRKQSIFYLEHKVHKRESLIIYSKPFIFINQLWFFFKMHYIKWGICPLSLSRFVELFFFLNMEYIFVERQEANLFEIQISTEKRSYK